MTKVFLLGGPRDGELIELDEPNFVVYERKLIGLPEAFRHEPDLGHKFEVTTTTYRRAKIFISDKIFHFGYPEGMSPEWAMQRLIDGYKPGTKA
jgi:hypothetical protein